MDLDQQGASLQKLTAELKASSGGYDENLECQKELLGTAQAVSSASEWSQQHTTRKEFFSVDADEEGMFRVTGVPSGAYFLVARGSAGGSDAVWTADLFTVKAGESIQLKLSSPEKTCLAIRD